jgi:hypothetical protein
VKTIQVVTIGVCGALYAGFGYLTHLGIFTPIIGVVRFWPAVIIPAVFAILFGSLVGGVGAALGIFISDMAIHGDALLSITVGVPSNFLGFYLVGYLGRKKLETNIFLLGLLASIAFAISSVLLYVLYPSYFGDLGSLIFVSISIICIGLTAVVIYFIPAWRSVNIASVIGLGAGALWIGVGVWVYSQFFLLPTLETNLSFFAALGWFVWTYFTEIPFLLLAVPPILKACYAAFSNLQPKESNDT